MRFSTALLAFVAAVSAQTGTATTEALPAATTALTNAQIQCLEDCDDNDVACRATCVLVPNPNDDQVNATTECVAACPQGNGTEAETQAYIDCSQDCVNQFYYNSANGGTPTGTAGSGSGSGSSASGSAAASTASGSAASGSASGSAASATGSASRTSGSASSSSTSETEVNASGDASAASSINLSGLGLLGVFAAVLAL